MSRSPKRPGVKRFDRAPQANIPRSTFDLSHPYKTTFDSGKLYPFLVEEVVPGDSFKVRTSALVRLATPLHPTMDNLHLETFYFFTPNRLLWQNWQRFMGEQDNPGDSTDYVIPVVTRNDTLESSVGTLWDHFGLPVYVTPEDTTVSALPFRAYTLIWNEWFRDENLQQSKVLEKGDGPDYLGVTNGDLTVWSQPLRRGKRKDYISSSLPFPQKGPGVDLPLGSSAPVIGDGTSTSWTNAAGNTNLGTLQYDNNQNASFSETTAYNDEAFLTQDPANSGWIADLSEATAATINDLRQAFQIQKLQERDARGGTRYTEIIRSHFQVSSPDQRLQRPEYLGGGYSAVQMNTVPQTQGTDEGGQTVQTPQGNLSAYGTATISSHGFTKSFVEHGYVIGLFSVRADLNYQQRIDRHWSRQTKYDYYWPALQALGEQPVYNREVWADGTEADNEVWGYQERWSEMRQNLGVITGKFRSAYDESLDPWHYALDFEERPVLNETFIQDNPPVARTIAVQDEPEFLMDAWHSIRAARPMPVYSVPGYIDHF